MMMTRETLIDILKANKVTVDFEKRDGSMRTMECTLMEGVVTPYERKTDTVSARAPDPDLISVWSIGDGAWRSFKMSKVTDIRIALKEQ